MLKIFRWLPVLVFVWLFVWFYIGYLFSIYYVLGRPLLERNILFAVFNLLVIPFIWSCLKTIFKSSSTPPKTFYVQGSDQDALLDVRNTDRDNNSIIEQLIDDRALPIRMVRQDGYINFCRVCWLIKPDRSEHCSICGRCFLRLNHHSLWFNRCIGLHNYKFFILSLMWGGMFWAYSAITLSAIFKTISLASVDYYKGFNPWEARVHASVLLFTATVCAVANLSLGCYHFYLASKNQTSLEKKVKPVLRNGSYDPQVFDMGRRHNLREIFGPNIFLAMLPVNTTKANGITWHYRSVWNN